MIGLIAAGLSLQETVARAAAEFKIVTSFVAS
jgi:hypothetical protein